MLRCTEGGWIELVKPDTRRGIWLRVTDNAVEICAGREGDDYYLKFMRYEEVTESHIEAARAIVDAFEYAKELAEDKEAPSEL